MTKGGRDGETIRSRRWCGSGSGGRPGRGELRLALRLHRERRGPGDRVRLFGRRAGDAARGGEPRAVVRQPAGGGGAGAGRDRARPRQRRGLRLLPRRPQGRAGRPGDRRGHDRRHAGEGPRQCREGRAGQRRVPQGRHRGPAGRGRLGRRGDQQLRPEPRAGQGPGVPRDPPGAQARRAAGRLGHGWRTEPAASVRKDLEAMVGCIGGALVLDDYVSRLRSGRASPGSRSRSIPRPPARWPRSRASCRRRGPKNC